MARHAAHMHRNMLQIPKRVSELGFGGRCLVEAQGTAHLAQLIVPQRDDDSNSMSLLEPASLLKVEVAAGSKVALVNRFLPARASCSVDYISDKQARHAAAFPGRLSGFQRVGSEHLARFRF